MPYEILEHERKSRPEPQISMKFRRAVRARKFWANNFFATYFLIVPFPFGLCSFVSSYVLELKQPTYRLHCVG